MVRTALVTGGAGFIGSHLVERLLEEGWRVRVLDDRSTGSLQNLAAVERRIELRAGDIRDPESCREAARGVEALFHLAAIASVARSVRDPLATHDVNVAGTLNLLMAARDAGVRRFVFSSSASVYGNAVAVPTAEDAPLSPQSPYASGKACGELYCRNFHALYGLETVILRYFNVFGPRQSADSGYAAVIPHFTYASLSGERPIVYGDGRQTRDFVYVANVAEANLCAATAPGAAGRAFNISGGRGVSLLALLEEIQRITGRRLEPEFRGSRPGDVRHSLADITQARRELRYEPSLSLEAGLRLTIQAAAAQGRGRYAVAV